MAHSPPPPPPPPDGLIGTDEAALFLGVSEQCVRDHCAGRTEPLLPARKIRGVWMILRRDLDWFKTLPRPMGRPPGSKTRKPRPAPGAEPG